MRHTQELKWCCGLLDLGFNCWATVRATNQPADDVSGNDASHAVSRERTNGVHHIMSCGLSSNGSKCSLVKPGPPAAPRLALLEFWLSKTGSRSKRDARTASARCLRRKTGKRLRDLSTLLAWLQSQEPPLLPPTPVDGQLTHLHQTLNLTSTFGNPGTLALRTEVTNCLA